jgi:tetratricopeptide (TPR) repeat protein
MKTWTLILAGVLLTGCASAPMPMKAPPGLLQDQLFAAPQEKIDTSTLFALSPAMRTYLDAEFRDTNHLKPPQRRLFDALYAKGQLKLEYDSAITRPAADTFNAKSGNCMSLVIMTAAFAKELGMPLIYQNVLAGETWSRAGNVYFASSHVNVSVGKRKLDSSIAGMDSTDFLTIDFLPPDDIRGHQTDIIEEETVIAMYLNNRAAEALARGELDNAYAWVREAIVHHPLYSTSFNTLGVIYLRHGNRELAESALRFALEREPQNTVIMSNLLPLLRSMNKHTEADALAAFANSINPHPAFQYFDLGMAAMNKGDYREARDYFKREVKRAPYYHEFHYWLAMAEFRLGETGAANEQLALAAQTSTTRRDRERYSAKLENLRTRPRQQ